MVSELDSIPEGDALDAQEQMIRELWAALAELRAMMDREEDARQARFGDVGQAA